MDTFGAPLFYGSGAVFAEYRSAWKHTLWRIPASMAPTTTKKGAPGSKKSPGKAVSKADAKRDSRTFTSTSRRGSAVGVMFFSSDPVRSGR